MSQYHQYRLWQISGSKALDTDLLSQVFRAFHIELADHLTAYMITPSSWLVPEALHALLEQDGGFAVQLTRGPLFDGNSQIALMIDIISATKTLSRQMYPERSVHTYEWVAQWIDSALNRVALAPLLANLPAQQLLNSYCETNLNVTATAEKLYVHRNTLLYRLDKLSDLTGFDLKRFVEVANLYYALKRLNAKVTT